jgi:hypothetical protein
MKSLKSALNKSILIYFTLFLFNIINLSKISAQKLPIGYIEQFSNICNNASLFNSFSTNRPAEWKTDKDNFLSVLPCSNDSCIFNFSSMCVLDSMIFGEYIIEFEIKIETLEGNDPYITFLSSIKSFNTLYAFLISKDSVVFYLVNKGNLKKLDIKDGGYLKIGWNKIMIQRDILTRNTSITFNNLQSSKLVFNDWKLVMGYLGFASGKSNISIRNINIWAPTSITDNSFKW